MAPNDIANKNHTNNKNKNNNKRVDVHSVLTMVSSTPVNPPGRTSPLTAVDRAMGKHNLHVIFYYRSGSLEFDRVRPSLNEALTLYPNVTGRLAKDGKGNWEVKFTDAGVRVYFAKVGCSVDEWLRFADGDDEMHLTVCDELPDDPQYWSPFRMQIVSTQFNGRNYLHWSRGVSIALSSKNKLGFINGNTRMPDTSSTKLQQWIRCDSIVRCWLINSMISTIKEGFMSCKTAKQIWTEVQERYGQSNGALLFQLKKDLRNISHGNDSIAEYFNKLKKFWDEIEEIEGLPECSCGAMNKCTCSLLKKMLDNASKEKVLTFLMGLSDVYEGLRSNILSMDPIPPINKVYSIVQQVESQKLISNVIHNVPETSAMNSTRQFLNNSQQGGHKKDFKCAKLEERLCSHCRKKRHTKDSCFRLHPEQKAKYMARFSANAGVHSLDETSLDCALQGPDVVGIQTVSTRNPQRFDPKTVTALYHQMMQMLQHDQKRTDDYSSVSVNFAGPSF